jgi:hypothetical protein
MRIRQELSRGVVAFTTVWLASVASAGATPIPLPSPITIELSDPFQNGDPGDVLTFLGTLTNTTADRLYIEGWGIGTYGGNTSEYPIDFSFTPEWFAWPKAVAFGPFEATPLMPLFTAAIAADFSGSRKIVGDFSVSAYPIGAMIYNPDGSLVYVNAVARFNIEIGDPPVLEPIPEPATLLTLLGGLAMIFRRRIASRAN